MLFFQEESNGGHWNRSSCGGLGSINPGSPKMPKKYRTSTAPGSDENTGKNRRNIGETGPGSTPRARKMQKTQGNGDHETPKSRECCQKGVGAFGAHPFWRTLSTFRCLVVAVSLGFVHFPGSGCRTRTLFAYFSGIFRVFSSDPGAVEVVYFSGIFPVSSELPGFIEPSPPGKIQTQKQLWARSHV